MAKWIEWIPETETAIYQQLMTEAGKHSGVIWMVEPPPAIRASCTPVNMEAIKHYMAEGGLPIGWVDLNGNVHSFVVNPPFDPPNLKLMTEDGEMPYGNHFTKDFIGELYNHICMQNMSLHKRNSA